MPSFSRIFLRLWMWKGAEIEDETQVLDRLLVWCGYDESRSQCSVGMDGRGKLLSNSGHLPYLVVITVRLRWPVVGVWISHRILTWNSPRRVWSHCDCNPVVGYTFLAFQSRHGSAQQSTGLVVPFSIIFVSHHSESYLLVQSVTESIVHDGSYPYGMVWVRVIIHSWRTNWGACFSINKQNH